MDFRPRPPSRGAQARMKHENWGYLDMGKATPALTHAVAAWNKKRTGVEIDPDTIVLSAGVHPR